MSINANILTFVEHGLCYVGGERFRNWIAQLSTLVDNHFDYVA
jgi:hypothetical protein